MTFCLDFFHRLLNANFHFSQAETTYHAEWADIAVSLDATCVVLRSFHENLERTKHTQLPEPFPSRLIELLQ